MSAPYQVRFANVYLVEHLGKPMLQDALQWKFSVYEILCEAQKNIPKSHFSKAFRDCGVSALNERNHALASALTSSKCALILRGQGQLAMVLGR